MAEPVNTPTNGHWYPPPAKSDADLTKDVKKDIAKNTANVPPSSSVQNCPLANKPAPKNDPKNKVCNFTAVKVSKPNRNFDLIVSRSTPSTKRTLGIVAGFKNKPAKVSVELKGPAGPCPETHNNKRSFNTGSHTFKILPASNENLLELEVTSSTQIQINPWGLTTDKYTIDTNRCGHISEPVTIEVYPDTETDVYLGWDFGETKTRTDERDEVKDKPGNRKAARANAQKGKGLIDTKTTTEKNTETKSGLRVGGELKYDGKSHKIDVVFKETIKTLEKVGEIVKRSKLVLDQIQGKKDEAALTKVFDSPMEFGMKLPVVELHVGGSWKEDAGAPTVTYNGKVKFVAKPLFGLFFRWNITSTVLQSLPGGVLVQKVKKQLAKGFMDLYLKAGVEIAGELEFIIKNREIAKVTGKVSGKIPVVAELVVIKGEWDVWIAHASIEVKVAVESGLELYVISASDIKGFKCYGQWLDLVIWISEYDSFGYAKGDAKPNKYSTSKEKGAETKYEVYRKKFEGKHEFFKKDITQA